MRIARATLLAAMCVAVNQAAMAFPAAQEPRAVAVTPDRPAAAEDLRQQAERGDAAAAYRLGLMYRNGFSLARDAARAACWIELAAQRGVAAAMFTLSNMLDEGEGVAADKAAARRWLEAAAEREYPEALQQMALTETDPARAALLMKQAAHAMRHRSR